MLWDKANCLKLNEKVIKLEGILKDKDIDLNSLNEFKQQTWQHVDQEFSNGYFCDR
jgi:hypothetical protein